MLRLCRPNCFELVFELLSRQMPLADAVILRSLLMIDRCLLVGEPCADGFKATRNSFLLVLVNLRQHPLHFLVTTILLAV